MKHKSWLLPWLLSGALASANDDFEVPSGALLEFLADWELPNGDWVAPEEIARMQIPPQSDDNDKPAPKPTDTEVNKNEVNDNETK